MIVLLWAAGGCSADDVASPASDLERPSLVCPGDPQCPDNDGVLRAGAAVRSVVPECFERWDDLDGNATYEPPTESFRDCGCDGSCPVDSGYPGADDGEGDGEFQAIWIAGFQNSRPANGVRGAELGLRGAGDGLWATAVVLDQGTTRIGIVAIDAFGLMINDSAAITDAARVAGLDIDHLVVHSSHSHAAPDVLGVYGPTLGVTGYDANYTAQLRARVTDALTEAVGALEEVTVEVGVVNADDYHADGVGNLIVDTRDPVVVDPLVSTARFVSTNGSTLATLVHFSNHPEETASRWALISANFVHALRRTVEEGVDWGQGLRPGTGGVAIYLNGAIGGMMTSLDARVEDPNGIVPDHGTFEKADVLGQLLGGMALDAVDVGEALATPRIAARRQDLFLPVTNTGFQAMFTLGALAHRTLYNHDVSRPASVDNVPDVASEVGLVEIGPLRILCLPGEALPELAIGGYDGSFTPTNQTLIRSENDNPPHLSAAPRGPYLLEQLDTPWPWILGLANDEVGYIIPEYDFEVGQVPFLIEADGDHYEETNSLGADTAPLLLDAVDRMLGYEARQGDR